jgi:SAM-dependent methyltransferase
VSDSLDYYRHALNKKPLLRRIYSDFYDRILRWRVDGRAIEVGGGIGHLKKRFPEVVTTDIQIAPWLDLVADAHRLPFPDNSISNIILVDVLHHLEYPILFLREAERTLRAGGRCIMVEPGITLGSTLFYRCFHHEPVRMNIDPLIEGALSTNRNPYDSNQAIPSLLIGRDRNRLAQLIPTLSLIRTEWFSLIVYPLSGGFKPWTLLSDRIGRSLLSLEKTFEPLFGPIFGFRLLIVLEKRVF